MLLDVYGTKIEGIGSSGPILISFDTDLLRPEGLSCRRFLPLDLMKSLANTLVPGHEDGLVNGMGNHIENEDIQKAIPLDELRALKSKLWNVRGEIIDRYGHNSEENEEMMRVSDHLDRIRRVGEFTRERSGGLLSVIHGANMRYMLKGGDEFSVRLPSRSDKAYSPSGPIYSARVRGIDPESRTYIGEIFWADSLEGVSLSSRFVAHPIPEIVGYKTKSGILIRDKEFNILTGGHHFTIQSDTNESMKEYILPLITETDKLLSQEPAEASS